MARWSIHVCYLVAIWPSLAVADMIDTSGLQPWEPCALCHGTDGVSVMAKFPRLAGQPEAYLIKQLEDFRYAHRLNDDNVMADNAGLLSRKQVLAVAKYFSAQDAPSPIEVGELASTELGGALFQSGRPAANLPACASCHVDGEPSANYPAITAQHPGYIEKQLRDFRDRRRQNDPDGVMQSIADKLTEKDIKAVAAFAGGQSRQKREKP